MREGQARRETKEGDVFAELDIFDETDELCFLLINFVSHFLVVVSVEQCPLSLEATYTVGSKTVAMFCSFGVVAM